MSFKNKISRFLSITLTNSSPMVFGGQAVMEGVMMKSPNYYAISVRNDKGDISSKTFKHVSITKKNKFLGWYFIRGIVSFVEMMILGFKSLAISAEMALSDEEEKLGGFSLFISLFLSIVLAILLFKMLPLGTATLLDNLFNIPPFLFNLIDGIVKIGVFVIYVLLIGMFKDVKNLFRYHGAEHKSISCYETGKKLTVDNVMKSSKVHIRCGTTFILLVLIISIIVYMFIPPKLPFFTNLGLRLAFLPLIASLSYELQRLSAKFPNNFLLKLFIYPGLLMQKLTTKEPDRKQAEVGLKSLQLVMRKEGVKI